MRVFGEIDVNASVNYKDIDTELLKRRTISVGDIDGEGNNIAAQIFLLDSVDHETPITLWVNSPGGDMYDLFCIYDMMQAVEAPIRTVCMGIAASSAAVLLASGTKGHRYITPHSYAMIHQIQVENISGTGTELALEAKESKRMSNCMAEILARHSGQGLAKVKRDYEHDRYLNAADAVSYGLVDYILEPRKTIPSLRRRRKPKPKEPKKEPPKAPANNST